MIYHGTCNTQEEKYDLIFAVEEHGGTVTDVSGYGDGYIVHFEATDDQMTDISLDWLELP